MTREEIVQLREKEMTPEQIDLDQRNLRKHWRGMGFRAVFKGVRCRLGGKFLSMAIRLMRPHVSVATRFDISVMVTALSRDMVAAEKGFSDTLGG